MTKELNTFRNYYQEKYSDFMDHAILYNFIDTEDLGNYFEDKIKRAKACALKEQTSYGLKRKGKFVRLTFYERILIDYLHNKRGLSNRKIGEIIGRNHSTVDREIKKYGKNLGAWNWLNNRDEYKYNAVDAQMEFEEIIAKAMLKHRKIIKDIRIRELMQYLSDMKKEHNYNWSINLLYKRFVKEHKKYEGIVSVTTLYRLLYLYPEEFKDLKFYPKGYGHKRGSKKGGAFLDIPTVSERPPIIGEHKYAGHLEFDTVVSRRGGKACLVTAIDPATKMPLIEYSPCKEQENVYEAMKKMIDEYEKKTKIKVLSITIDNGTEFGCIRRFLEQGIQVYRCHAYSSWEKGSVERLNRQIREYIPKGAIIENYSREFIKGVQYSLEIKPRAIFNYKSPLENILGTSFTLFPKVNLVKIS